MPQLNQRMNTILFSFGLLVFALSFAFFKIQSDDLLIYLSMARDFILPGHWPKGDPYIYSRPSSQLQIAHEYLSYLYFYGAWELADWTGVILSKVILIAGITGLVVAKHPRLNNTSLLFLLAWMLAIFCASFRFIERSSLFSDLFCLLLCYWLINQRTITKSFITRLSLLFLTWAQLHPGFLLGAVLVVFWAAWNWAQDPDFRNRKIAWLLLPIILLALNPDGLAGALYPLRFALNEAQTLKKYNLEWMPMYHPLFRFRPESFAFYALCTLSLFVLYRDQLYKKREGFFVYFLMLLGITTIRFSPWAGLAIVMWLKPWLKFQIRPRLQNGLAWTTLVFMLMISGNNLLFGYNSTSGVRTPGFELDPTRFPLDTFEILLHNPIQGRVYNSGSLSGYLIWKRYTPIFHHGFVTDMSFYESEVAALLQNPEVFFRLTEKYGWKILLIDKGTDYHYFYQVLVSHPEWKIVAEDKCSYLIYRIP